MKKIVFLLSLFVVVITGCTIESISDYDINQIVLAATKNENKLSNNMFEGYKYYLPRGMTILGKDGYNAKILANGDYYYLYVDIISYYHKTIFNYEINSKAYFSRLIKNNDITGYIEINRKKEDEFFIEIVYNYAKIEVITTEDNLKDVIFNSIQILSSVKYNDEVIDTLVGENILNYKEESYSLFESKKDVGDFLDYVKEFDKYTGEEEQIKDDDILETTE